MSERIGLSGDKCYGERSVLYDIFNLPSIYILVMESNIICNKTPFLWYAPSSQSVYFGEIIRVITIICIFPPYLNAAKFVPMLGGCYCRLRHRMFIWLDVESGV